MKRLLVLAVIFTLTSYQDADACGGGGSGVSSLAAYGGRSVSFVYYVPSVNPLALQQSQYQAQYCRARQAASARAAAYKARMQPIRLANARRIRAEKLALREARIEKRLAKLEAAEREQQAFLAEARTWVDTTGEYQVLAILVDANDWGVKLKKKDGSTVNVPIGQLSSSDRVYVASVIKRDDQKGILLVGI